MLPDPTLTLADQIFWLVDVFLKTLAPEACQRRIGLLSGAIWNRVRTFERRFLALYAMWKAGRLPKARARAAGHSPCPPSPRRPSRVEGDLAVAAVMRPAGVLPRTVAWMYKMTPMSAGTLAGSLGPLILEHPEMKAFVTECPQAGRLLRPVCRMVGIRLPEWLALPQRRRIRKKREPLPPHPRAARFPDTPAARSAARALARMQAGLPVNFERMSAVARGYFLHPPRDDNCPPPEIGYGGRSFGPLPKDYVRPKDWE